MAYKILSLDGGGSWAMIQARVLLDLYGDLNGHELLRNFDMVIANSGGSLVLASLCCNIKLSDVIGIFEKQELREQVFSHLTFAEELKHVMSLFEKVTGVGPKYATERKLSGLQKILTDKQVVPSGVTLPQPYVYTYLDELPALIGKPSLQILIVGYDYFRRRANFFRSNPQSNTNRFGGQFTRVQLGHAIHASSNAPVNYFDEPATIHTSQDDGRDVRTTWFWDGAVSGFNNPVLAGLVEAVTNGLSSMDNYRILSLGTGTGDVAILTDYDKSTSAHTQAIYDANKGNALAKTDHSFSFLNDVKELATSILADPPDSDTFIAYSMLHPTLPPQGNIVRINPCLKPTFNAENNKYEYPPVYKGHEKDFLSLLGMDMDAVLQSQVDLIKALCDKFIIDDPAIPRLDNQLIRGRDQSTDYLGHFYYHEAKERWKAISGA